MIKERGIPDTVLSVTVVLGCDFVHSDTPLSRLLGLRPGDQVPFPAYTERVLLWVESAVLTTPCLSPQEWRYIRGRLGMTDRQFAAYLCLPVASVARFECGMDQRAVDAFVEGGMI